MKVRTFCSAILVCSFALVGCQATGSPVPTPSASQIPHLRKQVTATQLIVVGKPFLALAGELGNNTATSLEYMKHVWPKLIVHRRTREEAIAVMKRALNEFHIAPIKTTIPLQLMIMDNEHFKQANVDTGFVERVLLGK